MNEPISTDATVAQNTSARFSTETIPSSTTSGITQRREFRGNPRLYAKQLTIIGAVAVIGLVLLGYFGLGERNPKFYLFMCGIAVTICVGRYFSMMGLNGPPALVFDPKGITIQRSKKATEIPWADLRFIRNEVIRGGQLWEIVWKGGKYDYFIDGLTGAQKIDLKRTIGSINLPHVAVRLEHYETV